MGGSIGAGNEKKHTHNLRAKYDRRHSKVLLKNSIEAKENDIQCSLNVVYPHA